MESADGVLASETRKGILERLSEKNHRPSDLSRELGKDKSTIVEHLEKLRQAGLVERLEREGHKWIFYRLSKNGEAFFPDRKKRVIFLALAMISLAGALLSFLAYMGQPFGEVSQGAAGATDMAKQAEGQRALAAAPPSESAPQPAQPRNEVYFYAAVALLTLFIVAVLKFALAKAGRLAVPKGKK